MQRFDLTIGGHRGLQRPGLSSPRPRSISRPPGASLSSARSQPQDYLSRHVPFTEPQRSSPSVGAKSRKTRTRAAAQVAGDPGLPTRRRQERGWALSSSRGPGMLAARHAGSGDSGTNPAVSHPLLSAQLLSAGGRARSRSGPGSAPAAGGCPPTRE